ncbi:MAG: hypothetical protein A2085_08080 [Gemmatimonadetes bacterium GWC2_71_10]|nr:MAG: hypothetical protein A2085_08080 [Gemmatimonadetes bacterium GWC2_71_10]
MSLVTQARRQAGEVIARSANEIAQSWRDAVRADQKIEGDDKLPDLLLTNQVPALLAEIAAALAEGEGSDTAESSIARRRRGIRFGKLRGLAQYDAADLYREFKHLRQAVWKLLRRELDWSRGDAFEVMLVIDQYLDEVIGASLRGFFEASERAQGGSARSSGETDADQP